MPNLKRVEDAFISKHWRWEFHPSTPCPETVLGVLIAALPHIDPLSWPSRSDWGGIFVNGRRANLDRPLHPPCSVEYYEPKFDYLSAEKFFPAFRREYVVFEDQDLLAAYKPAGLPCMPAREQEHYNFKRYLERYCGAVIHMPSRVDMSTQGLVIVSKSPAMHGRLQQLFERREITKRYLLQVAGTPEWPSVTVEQPIGKDPSHAVLRTVAVRGGKSATTEFRAIANGSHTDLTGTQRPTTVLEARPRTGRTHQIRVHAKSLGFPIVGDNFYGGPPASQLHLVSFCLEFLHPFTNAPLVIQVAPELCPEWAAPYVDRCDRKL